MIHLLATNILSEPLKALPNQAVLDKLAEHERDCVTATLVWHELLFGLNKMPKSKKRRTLERYLLTIVEPVFSQLPYDSKAARWHASERARLERLGKPQSFVDGQIAAVAATNDLILVTRNVRDFANFKGLKVENWFE